MSTDLHRQCWLMLPWIVTGRVAASDKQRFERHIAECAECRAELERQRELCERIRSQESVMLAPQSSLQKLMARIDSSHPEPLDESSTVPVSMPKARPNTPSSPRWLSIAAGVQTLAIAALLALVWQQREAEMSEPRFTTLSTAATPQPTGKLLRVVFSAQMTNAEVQELLRSVAATVVAGPTEAGVYTLRLTQETPDEVGAVLTQVRADPNVVFAEPVTTEVRR